MADKKLVAIYHVSFLVEPIILSDLINLQFLDKVCCLVHFEVYSLLFLTCIVLLHYLSTLSKRFIKN